jgi:hypothetical protein
MDHVFPCVFVFLLGALALSVSLRSLSRAESQTAAFGFLAHIAATFLHLWIVISVYRGGDLLHYLREAEDLARVLDYDFATFFPEVISLFFQTSRAMLPVEIVKAESSAGTVAAISGTASFLFAGSSYATCLAISLGSFFSKLALYRAFREALGGTKQLGVLAGLVLLPSSVFWSAVILKEAFVMVALGPWILGVQRIAQRRFTTGILYAGPAMLVIGLVKPYIAVAAGISCAAWVLAQRSPLRRGLLTPARLFAAGIVLLIVIPVLGAFFPAFSIDTVAERAADMQDIGTRYRGGSSYDIGDGSARSLTQQLAFAPLALVTAWFRPFPFEVGNVLMVFSSAEAAMFLWFAVAALRRRSLGGSLQFLLSHPILLYALAYSVILGVGVGLGTTNLGTLARYRAPILPVFFPLLIVVGQRLRSGATSMIVQKGIA